MAKKGIFAAALLLGACSGSPVAEMKGTLTASEAARAMGVSAYRIEGDVAALIGSSGAVMGTLHITAPDASTRFVRIAYDEGRAYENEVTRPVDSAFVAPLGKTHLEELVQLDPALAPLFARYNLSFISPSALAGQASEILGAEAIAYCSDITFAAGCNTCLDWGAHPCWAGSYGGGLTKAGRYATCTPVSCGQDGMNDLTYKERTCYDPGSCTNQAYGFQGCTSVTRDCTP